MKRFTRRAATAGAGVSYVSGVVFGEGSIFREFPQQTDVGIDGIIELVDDQVATGIMVAVQVKSGPSFLNQRRPAASFSYHARQEELEYWQRQFLPVALIFYDPESRQSAWLDVTSYIRRNPRSTRGPVTLSASPLTEPFEDNSFHTHFKENFRRHTADRNPGESAEAAVSLDPEQRFAGLVGLLGDDTARFSRLTCHLLFDTLFDPDANVRVTATDALSRYLPHPEVSFAAPAPIRDYVLAMLARFGRSELVRLLDTALLDEDNLMQRGSLGQSVGVIITHVPGYEDIVYDVATDSAEPEMIRFAALALAGEFGLGKIIEKVAQNLDYLTWESPLLGEAATWLADFAADELDERGELRELVDDLGYDNLRLADLLERASLTFLLRHEQEIETMYADSRNSAVRFEAGAALRRIAAWRNPPEKHTKSLFEAPDSAETA